MPTGKENLKRIHDAVAAFEEAVAAREHKGLTQSRTALQQEVDRTRDALVKLIVTMVTEARLQNQEG